MPEIDPSTYNEDAAEIAESPQNPELVKAQAEIAELKDAFLRAKAETDNARKIAQAEIVKERKYAIERFAEDLLPVKDALEKALATEAQSVEAIKAGAELTLKALNSAFDKARLTEIAPAPGERFDPHRHEAMQLVPSAQPANTVVDVYRKGYLINDRILRSALVSVSSGDEGKGG
jgi:molecular chaperone GrpE